MIGAFCRTANVQRRVRHRACRRLRAFGLRPKADMSAASLTLPDRKMLELARAVAAQPKLLLLDEVMAGLRPSEGDEIVAAIKELHASGVTVLLIEHVMRVVMALAQRVVVLHHGEKIAEGTPAEVGNDRGRDRKLSRQEGETRMSALLQVENLEVGYGEARALNGISFAHRQRQPVRHRRLERRRQDVARPLDRRHVAAEGRPYRVRRRRHDELSIRVRPANSASARSRKAARSFLRSRLRRICFLAAH